MPTAQINILPMLPSTYSKFVLLGVFSFLGCSTQIENSEAKVAKEKFFSLESYFDGEIERLSNEVDEVQKWAKLNGQEESEAYQGFDFEKALQIFKNADINKPAWFGKYEADTVFTNNNIDSIKYTSLDPSLRTKLIHISFTPQKAIKSIEIEKSSKSFVAETTQELAYNPSEGFSVLQAQKVVLGKKQETAIKIEFL